MIRLCFFLFVLAGAVSIGARDSGVFFEGHVSRGTMDGDNLCHFEGTQIGVIKGDSVYFIENGREGTRHSTYTAFSTYPVDFQYAVRYSFCAGYEKPITRALSLRGALGYQKASMDAYGAMIQGGSEVPFVDARIDRHWLTIPVDLKVTLPILRNRLYCSAGPKVSILLSSKYTDKITTFTEDLSTLMPKVNLGAGLKLGAEFPIARAGFLFIESGYHLGLLNTSPVSSAATQEGEIALLGMGFKMNVPW